MWLVSMAYAERMRERMHCTFSFSGMSVCAEHSAGLDLSSKQRPLSFGGTQYTCKSGLLISSLSMSGALQTKISRRIFLPFGMSYPMMPFCLRRASIYDWPTDLPTHRATGTSQRAMRMGVLSVGESMSISRMCGGTSWACVAR